MAKLTIDRPPYFKTINGRHYWNPPQHVLGLGFSGEALGDDLVAALTRARELYDSVKAERARDDEREIKKATTKGTVTG